MEMVIEELEGDEGKEKDWDDAVTTGSAGKVEWWNARKKRVVGEGNGGSAGKSEFGSK